MILWGGGGVKKLTDNQTSNQPTKQTYIQTYRHYGD